MVLRPASDVHTSPATIIQLDTVTFEESRSNGGRAYGIKGLVVDN